ncbi:hypothetical protein PRZ48_015214 [Zasmidium cellare]|uniref:Uncharacterized protein n=1 Tax=Zasmidium cellare TaxID=395010 RepID=A0ABR0DXX1_ZASCE|nr:hypothetical protein PRZ48_015214 [Zasmidium cellare]
MIRFGDEQYFKELGTYQDAIPLAHAEMIGPVLEARVTALRKLNEKVLSVVEDISQYMMPEWDHRADSQPQEDGTARDVPDRCKYFEGLANECLRALGSASIWPRQSQEGTVHGLLCAINEFKVDPLLGVKEEGCFFCVQKLLEGTFRRSISSLKDEATKVCTLLCLDCVKNGGRPPVDRECRIAHN